MEDNDFGGLARDLERALHRKEAATKRFLVVPPRGSGAVRREFGTFKEAEDYAGIECPAHTRIVDRMPEQTPEASPNPPNPKQRYGDLKVPLGLVPSSAKIYMALALAEGAAKYGFFNWRDQAVEAMTYIHALERHVSAWVDGEDTDPSSGKPHLGHAMACLAILADATEVGNLIDNRPLSAPTGELLEEFAADKPDDETLTTTFGPVEDYAGGLTLEKIIKAQRILAKDGPVEAYAPQEYPFMVPGHWWSHYTPAPAKVEEYPFTSHRTMAEIMAEEAAACPLDGRNCDHKHPAFGEGDETTWIASTEPEKPACHHHRLTQRCTICDPKPVWSSQDELAGAVRAVVNLVPTPKWDDIPDVLRIDPFDDMHPCDCDRGRCKIENGRMIGSRVFCCAAEEGR